MLEKQHYVVYVILINDILSLDKHKVTVSKQNK